MGTSLEITVCGRDDDDLEVAMEAAIAEIRRVEDVMTDWRPSPLMRLNEQAGSGPVPVPGELARVIGHSLEISRLSGGAFDVTYAAVGKLWDFKADPPRIPSSEAIEAGLQLVGWERVLVDLEKATVDLPEGMSIGLGGIAKGYGVDRAMAVLMEHGIEGALVNAGGDLKALGRRADGSLWTIAIKHPRDRDRVMAALPLANVCVVTSGDYERFFEVEGRRYHHILDPRSGYPSRGCMSATVVGPDAAQADALATALCILGPEAGLELIEGIERTEALVVGMDGKVQLSSGLK
jgi:thiamine biosynthesis lipoprotein